MIWPTRKFVYIGSQPGGYNKALDGIYFSEPPPRNRMLQFL